MKTTHFEIKGIKEVMRNIRKEMDKKQLRMTTTGFIEVAIFIRRLTENSYPLTPVDTGNLRASWFTVTKKTGEVDTGTTPLIKPQEVSPKDLQAQKSTVAFYRSVCKSIPIPNMIFGFSANYAAAVHEMNAKNWSRKGSGNKFLEKHLKQNENKIIEILAQEAVKRK